MTFNNCWEIFAKVWKEMKNKNGVMFLSYTGSVHLCLFTIAMYNPEYAYQNFISHCQTAHEFQDLNMAFV